MNRDFLKSRLLKWEDFPEGLRRFALDPTGASLELRELCPRVFLLAASKSGMNSTGFVVGEKGVLVIDAHINNSMANQIQAAIRKVTSKPLLYLVNANYHGDHTFGNCAFPKETIVLQHRRTAEWVPFFEEEKAFLLSSVNHNPQIFDGVRLRLPDLIFDDYLQIDLGGILVEVCFFGPVNSPGDTITYIPQARIAFTGNISGGAMVLALENDAGACLETLTRMVRTLAIDLIVPSHSPPYQGTIQGLNYLADLNNEVLKAIQSGWTLEEARDRIRLKERFLPPEEIRGPFQYEDFHKYNVAKTYKAYGFQVSGGDRGKAMRCIAESSNQESSPWGKGV